MQYEDDKERSVKIRVKTLFSDCLILNFARKLYPIRNTHKIFIRLCGQNRFVRVGYPSGRLSLVQGMTQAREGMRHLTYATETKAQITAT